MDVTATGYQWWFKFEYNSEKIQTAMGEQNLATGNELVVPVGKPVRVQLRTVDVIHSFWIPKLAGKVDMIPNRPNFLWFKADHAGYFYGQCAEYCGDSHAIMRFRVIALEKEAYAHWLANQKQPARDVTTADASRPHVEFASLTSSTSLATGPGSALIGEPSNAFKDWQAKQNPGANEDPAQIAKGRKLFSEKTCISCHTVRGHDGIGITGPELTHVGARSSIAAGSLENSPEFMHQWILRPNYFKPGNKMFNGGYMDVDTGKPKFSLNDQEIDAIVAYLQSLK
jgi:cytochrome c oxidase subunit 2